MEETENSTCEVAPIVAPYVVITPAHNEEMFIEKTILSMINQTIRPEKWILVNDNSTDRTQEIIEYFVAHYSFMLLLNITRSGDRDFGNKVNAFNLGLTHASNYHHQYIGNLDADISLENNYFENILRKFDENRNLGIAGGMVFSCVGDKFISQEVASDSVAGAIQLFRRECFEQIGGYVPLPLGGIDAAAEIMARMNGWTVSTFPEIRVLEHRRTGTATAAPLKAKVNAGLRSQSLGYSFIFLLSRCIYRLNRPPFIIGSAATLYGYIGGVLTRNPVVLAPEVVKYLRMEQRKKLLSVVWPIRWFQNKK